MNFQKLFMVFCAVFFFGHAQAATKIDDPEKFIRGVYANFVKDPNNYTEPGDAYSPRIAQLFAADSADGTKGGGVGRLDWDAWVNGQATSIKDVTVTSRKDEFRDDRRVVQVTMTSFDKPAKVYFYFERVAGRWLIDDIRWPGPDGWTLSLVLKYGSDFIPDPDKKYPY
jgi:hypothetical protein